MYFSFSSFDKENTSNIMSKKCPFSCQALYKRYWIMKWNGRRGVITPLFVYDPAFTYLRFISHHCNASESNFKDNLGIQDILIHQVIKLSKFTSSCICNSWGVGQYGVITMMISLEAFDWSEISEWLTCRNCELGHICICNVHKQIICFEIWEWFIFLHFIC